MWVAEWKASGVDLGLVGKSFQTSVSASTYSFDLQTREGDDSEAGNSCRLLSLCLPYLFLLMLISTSGNWSAISSFSLQSQGWTLRKTFRP